MTKKSVKENFKISFRKWEPLQAPYSVTELMLQGSFREHKNELQKYLYLGWKKVTVEDKKRKQPIFIIATGETRQEAKANFKADDSNKCWQVLPQAKN